MKPEDFDFLSSLLKERSGLVLARDKGYLLESRLLPVARRHGIKGLDELVAAVRARRDAALLRDITEAMTTNESLFFRDIKPFEIFKSKVLPDLMASRQSSRTIKIWCAASSSGQEPYSIAMTLKEEGARVANWRIEIVATDISVEMLEKAKAGSYSQFEVQRGLPINLLLKYFKQVGDKWQIDNALRGMVKYREFNLLDDPATLGSFDIIFCRNVLIYFDPPTKTKVLDRMSRILAPDGFLYLGGAETVIGVTERFQPLSGYRGVYCQAQNAARQPSPMAQVAV
ncbi:MAG: protein-glutamate O-methyltransferase [Alphaproteobacteria bacterium]|nr:protein-glutamate O-methyltransferase [Alphaproteobacteria bacterium]